MEKSLVKNYPHKINDLIMYRHSGICRIVDIKEAAFDESGGKIYYVLSSVYDPKTLRYVPAEHENTEKFIRSLFTKEQIDAMIDETEQFDGVWINDAKKRTEQFGVILRGENTVKILWLIKALSLYKKALDEEKKKFYASDEKILTEAVNTITAEFAYVLGIEKNQVIPYILSRIGKTAETE